MVSFLSGERENRWKAVTRPKATHTNLQASGVQAMGGKRAPQDPREASGISTGMRDGSEGLCAEQQGLGQAHMVLGDGAEPATLWGLFSLLLLVLMHL